jgi:hypothetical protein
MPPLVLPPNMHNGVPIFLITGETLAEARHRPGAHSENPFDESSCLQTTRSYLNLVKGVVDGGLASNGEFASLCSRGPRRRPNGTVYGENSVLCHQCSSRRDTCDRVSSIGFLLPGSRFANESPTRFSRLWRETGATCSAFCRQSLC